MCVALPAHLVAVDGSVGIVEIGGRHHEIILSFVPEARVGNWLLVHSGAAVRVISAQEAAELDELTREVGLQG